jgi:putative membrane protein
MEPVTVPAAPQNVRFIAVPSYNAHRRRPVPEARPGVKSHLTDFPLINGALFAGLGIVLFLAGFAIASKLAPFDVWKEIVQERNVAAGIVAGAVVLGLCWIIAASMH